MSLSTRAALLAAGDPRCQRPDWRAATLALLPRKIPVGPPELQLVLAELYLQLGAERRLTALPEWAERVKLPPVQLAFLRAELALCPERLPAYLDSPLLRPALLALRLGDLAAPLALATQLGRCPAADLQRRALPLAREALHAGRLEPAELHGLLVTLLESPHTAVLSAVLEELAEPWALCFPYPREVLGALPAATVQQPGVARALLRLAAAAGLDGPLRGVLADDTAAPERRREALRLLAHLGRREDLGPVLATASQDPLLLGSAALAFLHGRHQRGHFVGAEHVAPILDLYLGNTELSADALAPLLYPARAALLEQVATLAAADLRWERLLPLLCALGPDEPAVAPQLRALLGRATEPYQQQQVLAALAALRDSAAEEQVLALLPALPEAALAALRALGGERTVAALATALGLPQGEVEPWLRPFAPRAVALLWQLVAEDSPLRAVLLTRLDPTTLPAEILADLGLRPLPQEVALRRLAEATDSAFSAAAALGTVARSGDVALAEALLLRCVSVLHGGARTDSPSWGEEAPRVPAAALAGIRALGQRLAERCRIRPLCLLDARDPTQAGELLLAELALRLLQRADLAEGERVILLKLVHKDVAPWALPQLAARLRPLLRDRSPHVRKLAIACLSQRGAERLAHNLTRLLAADDIQTVRQALLALSGMKARFAADAIAGCLEHPNMNVKKAAAEALAQAGTPRIVPRILFWLGYHDNPGLRSSLLAALGAILGPAQEATLRAAYARAATPRQKALLCEALAPGDPQPAGSDPGLPADEERRAEVLAVVHKGWELRRAQALLTALAAPDAEPLGPTERATLRPYLAEWLGMGPEAIGLVAQLYDGELEERERELLGANLDLLLAALGRGAPGREVQERPERPEPPQLPELPELLDLLERLAPHLRPTAALRVAKAYRDLPPRPNLEARPPFALLRACRAALQGSDLHRALLECADTSDPQAGRREVLSEAFLLDQEGLPGDAEAQQAKAALDAAVYADDRALDELLAGWPLTGRPRATLRLLADTYPDAPAEAQPRLLAFMLALQLPFVPAAAKDRRSSPRARREPPPLDRRAKSAGLAQLAAAEKAQRLEAARALLKLPDPEAHDAVLTAYLAGQLEGPEDRYGLDISALARRLVSWPEARYQPYTQGPGRRLLARIGAAIPVDFLPRFVPLFLRFWEDTDEKLAAAAAEVLRNRPAAALLPTLAPLLAQGRWGALELLCGPVPAHPEWEALLQRLAAEGRAEQAAALRQRTVAGPLVGSAAATVTLDKLTDREESAPAPLPALAPGLARPELLRLGRATDRKSAEPVRAALSALAQKPDAEVVALLIAQLEHQSPRVRLHAHRLLRGCVDRQQYLELTCRLLDEKDQHTRRSAMRALAHGQYAPALPRLLALLADPQPAIRAAAAEAIRLFGHAALPLLIGAERKERPDRREIYAELIARIERDPDPGKPAAK